jgi:hypothetical protein
VSYLGSLEKHMDYDKAMDLTTIVRRDAEFVARSGIVIDWSTSYETVSIGNVAYLDGAEASALIEQAYKIYMRTGATTMEMCMMSVCKGYVECAEE